MRDGKCQPSEEQMDPLGVDISEERPTTVEENETVAKSIEDSSVLKVALQNTCMKLQDI